jgi:hypothetical protein
METQAEMLLCGIYYQNIKQQVKFKERLYKTHTLISMGYIVICK